MPPAMQAALVAAGRPGGEETDPARIGNRALRGSRNAQRRSRGAALAQREHGQNSSDQHFSEARDSRSNRTHALRDQDRTGRRSRIVEATDISDSIVTASKTCWPAAVPKRAASARLASKPSCARFSPIAHESSRASAKTYDLRMTSHPPSDVATPSASGFIQLSRSHRHIHCSVAR